MNIILGLHVGFHSYGGHGGSGIHYPFWTLLVLVSIPFVLAFIYWFYLNRNNKSWEKGIFPENLAYKRDNLLEAYICLAGLIIRNDTRDYRDKLKYVNLYFNKHFGDVSSGIAESLTWSIKNPIQAKTVAFWINRHVKEETKRMQILYFLVGLSFVDGQLIQDEYIVLKEITPLLSLNLKDLDVIINMYYFEEEKKKEQYFQSTITQSNSYKKEMALKILGLNSNGNIQELKLAYRKLVKIHHPDRFSNESKEQQALAHEKFIKIQEAYEYLEKYI